MEVTHHIRRSQQRGGPRHRINIRMATWGTQRHVLTFLTAQEEWVLNKPMLLTLISFPLLHSERLPET
eukprot:656303-Amphidinium_carterae.1